MGRPEKPRPRIGFVPSAIMKDVYIDFTETRPTVKTAAANIEKSLCELGDVVSAGIVENRDDADSGLAKLQKANVDVLVYVAFAYQQGATPIRIMRGLDCPIIIWNTQDLPALPEEATFNQMWTNSGLAGLGDICNALSRIDRKYWIVTSARDDKTAAERLRKLTLAAAIKKQLKKSRIAAVGRIYEGMMDFRVDEFRFHVEIGPTIFPIDQNLIAKQMEKVSQKRIDEKVKKDRRCYNAEAIPDDVLAHSIQVALAMEDIVVTEYNADALAQLDQSWSFDARVGCVPSYGYLHLNSLGVPCTCERDILTAAALMMGQYVSGGPAALVEFFDMNFNDGTVVLCHDSNGNPAMAKKSKDITLNVVPTSLCPGDWGPGVGADLTYPPGTVTMVSLAAARTGWKMVVSKGEAVERPSRSIGAPYMVWKPDSMPLAKWCNKWLLAGSTHHMAIFYGNHTEMLEILAGMLNIDFEEV